MQEIKHVAKERRKRVTTGQMNRFLDKIDFQRAPVPMAKRIRIFYMTQAAVAPPTFVLFTDRNIQLHFAFQRFLENQIRQAFGFEGTPIWFNYITIGPRPRQLPSQSEPVRRRHCGNLFGHPYIAKGCPGTYPVESRHGAGLQMG
jgi:hypothetical protein